MPIVRICDADCTTVLKPGEAKELGWGYPRSYTEEAMEDIDGYFTALQEAAKQSRALFIEKRAIATKAFYSKYPNGKLPDDPEVTDVEA